MPYKTWLEYRKKGVGGSDASVVCGINRWKSPVELWMEKTGQLPYQEAGEAAYWGTVLESLIKTEFTKRTGIKVIPVNQILQSEDHPFMIANLDGTCQHPDFGMCVFEAKTSSAYRATEWDNSIPDEYMLQIQHYLAITGYMGAYIAVLIGGNTFKWTFIERDEELISMLIHLEGNFWKHVQEGVPPPLDGSEASAKFISERFPDSLPKSKIELPESAIDLIRQYEVARQMGDEYIEQKQEAENLLKQMMGEHEIGTVGGRIITWKSVSKEQIDSKTLKIEQPILYQKYANKTTYRRFSVKAAA